VTAEASNLNNVTVTTYSTVVLLNELFCFEVARAEKGGDTNSGASRSGFDSESSLCSPVQLSQP
jgi:hypothetical protein